MIKEIKILKYSRFLTGLYFKESWANLLDLAYASYNVNNNIYDPTLSREAFFKILGDKFECPEFEIIEVGNEAGYFGNDEVYVVIYFPSFDSYYKVNGWSSSYEGVGDWGSWYKVKRTQEITYYYERID